MHRDKDNLRIIKDLPCLACHRPPPNDAHHIKTRGSGGGDELNNLMPLCRKCHTAVHKVGLMRFCESYPKVFEYLNDMGWSYDLKFKKWVFEL